MSRNRLTPLLLLLLLSCATALTQETVLYKQVDTTRLYLEVYNPPQMDSTKEYPAMVFFFGGGWINGNRHHFLSHAKYFAQRRLEAGAT